VLFVVESRRDRRSAEADRPKGIAMMRRLAVLLGSLALAGTAYGANGVDTSPVSMVTVTASASASVANDRVHAWLRAESENASAAAASNDVNTRVTKALGRIKALSGLTVQTSGYSTQQIVERGKPTRWRVAQTVSIEGSDFAAIATLVTQLQDDDALLLSGIAFTVSEAKRRATEDELTQQALTSWRTRAQNAARGLGFGAWRSGHVTVSTSDFGRPQPFARGGISAMSAAPAPVPLEAGVTEVTVTVTGDAVLDSARVAPR
jgi:predicted secreted protein